MLGSSKQGVVGCEVLREESFSASSMHGEEGGRSTSLLLRSRCAFREKAMMERFCGDESLEGPPFFGGDDGNTAVVAER